MPNISITTRDVARELARRYSTMTHEELDLLESILVPMKFAKNELILKEGETCTNIYWVVKGLVRQFYYNNEKELTLRVFSVSNLRNYRSKPLNQPFLLHSPKLTLRQ